MKKASIILGLILTAVIFTACSGNKFETQISLKSGEYVGEQTIKITTNGGGPKMAIYYTLDGSEPTSKSMKYDPESPLKLNYSSELKAVTYDGDSRGPIAEAKYTIKTYKPQELSPEERVFLSNITGEYRLKDTAIIIRGDRTISVRKGQEVTESRFIVSVPEDPDGYKGTLTFTDNQGKEQKYIIDILPTGDDAVNFNGEDFAYIG